MGSMYAPILFLGLQHTSAVIPVVAVERTIFYRKRAAGMCSTIPYAFAQVFIEIPYIFVQAVFYGVIVYAMVGFEWTITKFLWYLFVMFFTLLYFTFDGMMSIAVAPNRNIAHIVSLFFYAIWNLFSGFIVPRPGCPIAWTLYGLVESQYGDLQNKITDSDETVEQFLRRYFGFRRDFLGVVAVVIAAYAVVFALIFAFAIKVVAIVAASEGGHELQVIIHDLLAEGLIVNEAFQVAAIIDKLPPMWKDFKNYLKYKRMRSQSKILSKSAN
ncbi:Pleiotropic drug resistance protein 3 [Capsicum baccatum]|uniref:Pleiotropic drug resistance protein 3 n=1 Tax=Capsicum baccatum TaxID=33114 RepID=A0A2G2X7A1_CAPBA|nr:Pleiotropic drug resistance protein 3 [Capsicum baccatum]